MSTLKRIVVLGISAIQWLILLFIRALARVGLWRKP